MAATTAKLNRAGFRIENADEPLDFVIKDKHITKAECGNPAKCVIAQALHDVPGYKHNIVEFQVGANVTKIHLQGKVIVRYTTPGKLAAALRTFDKTGQWGLPAGLYTLRPLSKSYRRPSRHNKMRHSGGAKSEFRGTPVAPTRNAKSVYNMQASMN